MSQFVISEYEALKRNEAWVDLSDRGRIRVLGDDRARLIHALSTNHVQQMTSGSELYAFFLTAQGRIVADAYVNCYDDHLLLDVEPETRETILKHIDHYIIADDVTLEDVTQSTFGVLAAGRRLYGDIQDKAAMIAGLNLTNANSDVFEAFRVAHIHPRFGVDFGPTTLPQETGVTRALHFSKGCYLGQEIVERIRSRGHVNKVLVGLGVQDEVQVPVGMAVSLNGAEIGQITSSTCQTVTGSRAIAMVRMAGATPGTMVTVNGISAEVSAVS